MIKKKKSKILIDAVDLYMSANNYYATITLCVTLVSFEFLNFFEKREQLLTTHDYLLFPGLRGYEEFHHARGYS